MATYPAWHYFVAAAIALLIGIRLVVAFSWLFGGVIVAVGIVMLVLGITKAAGRPAQA